MQVTVHTPLELTRFTDGRCEIPVDAATVRDALDAVFDQYPDLKSRVVDGNENLFAHLKLIHEQQAVPWASSPDRPVRDGDRIQLVLIASGG